MMPGLSSRAGAGLSAVGFLFRLLPTEGLIETGFFPPLTGDLVVSS